MRKENEGFNISPKFPRARSETDYMALTKASCLVDKRLCKVSGDCPDKDVRNVSKNKMKKRKLSDMLDYRWTKEELRQFYDTFRKYGKNWKKVAGLIRNRSIDMVESLYNLNRRYLSLPEGVATADGFLAMMTDHYNNLEGHDTGYEEKGASIKTMKPQKCSRGKCGLDISMGSDCHNLRDQSAQSSCRHISKKIAAGLLDGCWPRAVRKRTPRIPVFHNQALPVIEASQRGGFLPVSGPPDRSVLTGSVKEKHAEADMATSNNITVGLSDNCMEDYSRQIEVDNGIVGGDTRIQGIDDVDQNGSQCEKKKLQEMRPKMPKRNNCQFGEVGEAFSRRNKGFQAWKYEHKIDKEVSESSQGPREKNHIPFLEGYARDALEMLADISLNIELQTVSSESDPALGGEKQKDKNDSDHSHRKPGSLSASSETDTSKISVEREGGHFSGPTSYPPGSLTVMHECVKSRISSYCDKENSSTVSCKFNLPESLSVNPDCNPSRIMVQEDQQYASIVRCGGGVPLKVGELKKGVSPEGSHMEKAVSEAEQAKSPFISTVQHGFIKNRQIPEVETRNDFCVDICEKNKGDTVDAAATTVMAKDVANEEVVGLLHSTCSQSSVPANMQSGESDIKAIADLTCALNKKDEMLKELRHLNNVVSGMQMAGQLAAENKHVIEQYTRIVRLLNEVNDEVASASHKLKQCNDYNKNLAHLPLRSLANSNEFAGPSGSLIAEHCTSQVSGSRVLQTVMSSRQKAGTMVDAAVLAMSSVNGGEDAYMRISEALDSTDNPHYGFNSNNVGSIYICSYPWAHHNQETSFMTPVDAPDPRDFPSANQSHIPSRLISDCIATVYMIQDASETRYPPADVASILDHAVESLQPRCSQNLPVYRDIEKCMGYIKTQLLAMVPAPVGNIHTKISV